MDRNKLLDKAKIDMMLMPELLFFTTILFSLKTKWTDGVPTAGIDGRNLFINEEWFCNLTPGAKIGLLLHEVGHIAFNHITRRGQRARIRWNYAGDYVINNMITAMRIELPPNACVDDQYLDMNTEQVYEQLPEEETIKILIQQDGIGQDIMSPGTEAETKQLEQEIADIVLRAAMQVKNSGGDAGNIPGEILVELDRIVNPKLPWNVIFQNYMSSFKKDDYSWRRPNRRYLPDYYLPSAYSESLENIASAVDCSGSVSDTEFNHFIGEMVEIQERLKPDKITVIDFDTQIHKIQEITENTNIYTELEFHGRGGTDVHDVFKWAIENNPTVLIIFTDGYFSMPQDDIPTCPIVWIIHNNTDFESNIGETIHYEIEEEQ